MTPELERALNRRDHEKKMNRINVFFNVLIGLEIFTIGFYIGRIV